MRGLGAYGPGGRAFLRNFSGVPMESELVAKTAGSRKSWFVILGVVAVLVTCCATVASLVPGSPSAGVGGYSNEAMRKMATLINLNGELCGEVLSVRQRSGTSIYMVECTRYRNGDGRVTYEVDLGSGQVR